MRQLSLWETERLTLKQAIQISLDSLHAYGSQYRHWAIAYSGGKDSSATVAFVLWAVKTGRVPAPETLTVLYADTRQEIPPLQQTAMRMLDAARADGFKAQAVLPDIDDRFYVYIFGTGVGWPKSHFRWCTERIKVKPINAALDALRASGKVLTLTGMRQGESAARDQRIAISCSRDGGECGQGWFQQSRDSLAPLLHWRVCHVWDYLYFEDHGYSFLSDIAVIYGSEERRTGCIACHLLEEDKTTAYVIRQPQWAHLAPLDELTALQTELQRAKWRLRQDGNQRLKDGSMPANAQRLGPLTMEAREYGLNKVLDVQHRAGVDLINGDEQTRIRELWVLNTWPNGWTGVEPIGNEPLPAIQSINKSQQAVTPLLIR